jgi:hypothetical protein
VAKRDRGRRPGNRQRGRYVNDLTTVQNGLMAEVNAGQYSGATLGHVQAILSDINTAISAANASVSGGGTFGSVAAAETALRSSHLDIINIVKTDPALSAAATANDAQRIRGGSRAAGGWNHGRQCTSRQSRRDRRDLQRRCQHDRRRRQRRQPGAYHR